MKYLVLQVRRIRKGTYALLEQAPDGGPVTYEGVFLYKESQPPYAELTRSRDHKTLKKCGVNLTRRLARDPAIGKALKYVQGVHRLMPRDKGPPPIPTEIYPIMVDVGPADADNLPWEALWSEPHRKLLAHFRNWPVVRLGIAASPVGQMDIAWEPELRILAVLSAAQVDAMPEWEALKTAIEGHSDWVRVHVLTAQQTVEDAITAAAMPNVKVGPLYGKEAILVTKRLFRPHILHCFCHGEVGTSPRLLVATPVSWRSGEDLASLETPELDELGASRTLWLTTINACESARGQWDALSFARDMVARGMPVAVGMRDLLPSNVSHMFAEAFFGDLLTRLREFSGSPKRVTYEAVVEHLFGALSSARIQLHEAESNNADCVLPAMYLRRGFQFTNGGDVASTPSNAAIVAPAVAPRDDPSQIRRRRRILAVDERKGLRRRLLEVAILEQNHDEMQALGTPEKVLEPLWARVVELRREIQTIQAAAFE